jgi:phage shock protein C
MKRLYLSTTDKKISGVCGGIAEYFELDSTVVRLGWVVGTVLTGLFPGLIGYVVAAIVIPTRPDQASAGDASATG